MDLEITTGIEDYRRAAGQLRTGKLRRKLTCQQPAGSRIFSLWEVPFP